MSETSYYVEFAKSNRSKCKKCKVSIDKGEMRIAVEVPGEDFNMTSNYHPSCFKFPRKLGKISASDFVANVLIDKSDDGSILPDKCDDLIASIEKAQTKTPAKKSKDDMLEPLKEIKSAYEAQQTGEGKPPSKKTKNEEVELYGTYYKHKVDELKDVLRWNRQTLVGTKDVLLYKVIDGATNGRLAPCPLCGSRLKFNPSCSEIICGGSFDEASQVRLECAFNASTKDAPRMQPWYSEEPTEEEKADMDRISDAAKGKTKAEADDELKARADALDWDLSSRDGLRKAAKDMLELLEKGSKEGKTIDLPKENAMQSIGKTIASNKGMSASEILTLLIEDYGYVEAKQAKEEAKHKALETALGHPANAGVVSAISELADLYFKEGNRNAGASYKRVVKALTELTYEVTESNAKGLGKGKTKVLNIGKSSAEKIHEYMETGTIQKLEEKRKDLA